MTYIDIEEKIQEIRHSLESELKQANAIDSNGKATNTKLFEYIIDEKIQKIEQMESKIADEMGVAKGRYDAGILLGAEREFKEMREKHTINIDSNEHTLNDGLEKETLLLVGNRSTRQTFKDGIKKLIQRFKNRKQGNEYN